MKQLVLLILYLMMTIAHAVPELIIGTTLFNPPFNSLADTKDHFYGFDIDIMNNICKRLEVKCTYTPMVFNDLFSAIKARKIDLAIAAIIITTKREEGFLFSLPYLKSQSQFLTIASSTIQTPKDIINKKVGVRKGDPLGAQALGLYNNNVTVVAMPNYSLLLEGLNNKNIDVILAPDQSVNYLVSNTNNLYKNIGNSMNIGEGYGIMTHLGQNKLIAKINRELINMESDGTYLAIYSHYFFTNLKNSP